MKYYPHAYKSPSVWEIAPDRLKRAMERAGVNQSQLAAMVGLKQPSVGRLLTGETKTSRSLDAIARALNTTPAYLRGERPGTQVQFLDGDEADPNEGGERLGDKRLDFLPRRGAPTPQTAAAEPGLVAVREVELAVGMRSAYLDQEISAAVRYFSREWLDLYTRAPADKLIISRGSGDSMVPTIFDNDLVLIDTTQNTPRLADQVWAVSYCGLGSVKRLRPSKDGGWLLLSDNPAITPITAYGDEMHVLGRVMAYFRKM